MSDEPEQPPLRLKPRLRPASEASESSSAEVKPSAPEAPAESTTEAKPKLRLKPRLAAEPEAAPEKQNEPEASQVAETPADTLAEPTAEKPVVEALKSLRLKPKLSLESEPKKETVSPTPEAAPPAPEPQKKEADGEDKAKFRLKPRLAAEPEAAPVKEEKSAPTEEKKDETPAPMPPPVVEKPAKPEVPPDPTAAKAPPKFKLKKKNPEPAPDAAPTVADPASGISGPPKVEVKPDATGDDSSASAMPPPPLVHLEAADDLDEDDILLSDNKNAGPPVKKGNKPLVGLVVLIIFGVGGYFGWQQFGPGSAEQTAPASTNPAAIPKKPATTLPGQLIEKAQSAIEVRRQGEQDPVDAVLDGKDVPDSQFQRIPRAPVLVAEPELVPEQVTTQSQSVIAPGVTATTTTVMSAIEASPAFRSFVGQVRINGVFQGSPSRALLNGHTYREGALVDPALGIYFDHVISEKKLIVFRDSSGAIVQRKY